MEPASGSERRSPRPRQLDDPYPEALETALRQLAGHNLEGARTALREIPFVPTPRRTERWPATSTIARIYARDRYQCRYCGEKTILTPVMRLLSRIFPDEFPMHPNWKSDQTHPAFVSRSATLDHIQPIAGGGDPVAEDNLVTACWGCNRRKGDLQLTELGWELRDPADPHWRGLTELYEPAWIAVGRPQLSETEMTWMRATRTP
ncbi:HNH endonuclease [Isoptericola sp. NPDC019571]|uniref:HNH endonuclease n=1 Tax=Isoptericola sp. NPDC019571 TaxID=3364008 RepID=UPI0037B70208